MNDVKLRLHLRNALKLNLQVLEHLLHLIAKGCQLRRFPSRQLTCYTEIMLRAIG